MVRQRRDELSCLLEEAERNLEAARQQQVQDGEATRQEVAFLQGQLEQCRAELQVRQPPTASQLHMSLRHQHPQKSCCAVLGSALDIFNCSDCGPAVCSTVQGVSLSCSCFQPCSRMVRMRCFQYWVWQLSCCSPCTARKPRPLLPSYLVPTSSWRL